MWIISSPEGSVETAHCTCIAGAGEVCSHVGALLYALEYVYICRHNTSCTDVRSMWNVPKTSDVKYEPVGNMNYGQPHTSKMTTKEIPAVTKEETVAILKRLRDAGYEAVLMRTVEPFASEIEEKNSVTCPANPYKALFKEEYEQLYLGQLLQLANDHIKIEMTLEACEQIENMTRGQSSCSHWYIQRAGRITASNLRKVCKTSVTKPSLSLIKIICYPQKYSFSTAATKWGINHEKTALLAFEKERAPMHTNLKVRSGCGLVIDPAFPQLAASPDALQRCDCCGTGLVEVKCPYVLKTISLQEFAEKRGTCLKKSQHGKVYIFKCMHEQIESVSDRDLRTLIGQSSDACQIQLIGALNLSDTDSICLRIRSHFFIIVILSLCIEI